MSYKVEIAVGSDGFKLLSDPMDASEPTVRSAKQVESSNAIGSCTFELVPGCWCFDTVEVNDQVRVFDTEAGHYVFYGRVLYTTPQGSRDSKCEVVCEDAMGFLKDTVQYIDSKKEWFEGKNPKYPLESIDKDDDSRTIQASYLVKLVVGQHNNTIADNNGDSWKKFKIGTIDLDSEDTVTISAEYEASSFDMLCDIADELCCDFRVRYDGLQPILDFGYNIGGQGGSFTLGDNLVQCGLKTSMVDVKTRMFPFGEKYAKLEKIERKATVKNGAYKASTKSGENDWDGSAKYSDGKAAKTCRFRVDGSLKAVIKVGRRDKSYPMVLFTDELVSNKSHEVLRKYTTKKSTSDNITKYYPVPEKAKYCYVLGADSTCTTYGYYKNPDGDEIGKNYRVDLGFWKKYVSDSWLTKKLKANGLTLGKTVDGSKDTLYYLGRNEDVFGAVEGTCVKDDLLDTKKITTRDKKSHSLSHLAEYVGDKRMTIKAKRFINYAVKEAVKASEYAFELTATAYDLAAAGLDYTKLKLLDRWTVDNEIVGINHTSKVVRIERDLLSPWSVSVEFGTKVQRASGTAGGGTTGGLDNGLSQNGSGDDSDDAEDTYETLAGIAADAAEKAAEIAIEKADELDQLSYLISMDALAAGQMAGEAYGLVSPITTAFRELGEQAAEQAHETTVVRESNSKTIEIANDIARAVATYGYEMEKSVQRWQQTYTEQLDAWVPSEADDPEGTYADERAAIAEAYAKMYGANGTPESPEAGSAQGHLNAAKAENVEAATKEAEMRVAYAESVAEKNACAATTAKAQASYNKAKANYDKLKKKTKASKKELDASNTALNACKASLEAATKAEAAADTRCTEASANYEQAKADLAAAEAKVAAAQAEVDTAMNGLHVHYTARILHTARQILLHAESIQGLQKKTGDFEVTAEQISSSVKTLDAVTGALMRATNMVETDGSFTWDVQDELARIALLLDITGVSVGDFRDGKLGRHIHFSDDTIDFYSSATATKPYAQIGESGINGFYYVSPTRSKSASVKTYTTVTITSGEIADFTNSSGVSDWQGKYWYPYALVALKTTHSNIWKITGWDINPSAFNTDASGNLVNSNATAIKVYLSQLGYSQYGKKTISGSVKYQILWMKGSYTADVTDTDDTEGSGETGSGVISGMLSGSLNTSTNTLTITIN